MVDHNMKRVLLFLAPMLALTGCISSGKIEYTVRVDHFDGPEAVVLVYIRLNAFEHWEDTPHKAPPIGLARQLIRRELGKRGVFDYVESSISSVPFEGNAYQIRFKLRGEREKFRAHLGVNMLGDISSK